MIDLSLRASALIVTVVLAACSSSPAPTTERDTTAADAAASPAQPPTTSAMTPTAATDRLYSATSSGFEESAQRVVSDRSQWERDWRQLHGGLEAGGAPAVDFARDVVVLVAMGMRNSGGHAVRIDGVSPSGTDLIVHVTLVSPGASCMTTQEITQPAEAVRVRKPAGRVRVVTRTETRTC